jgi:hypothetical protein
LQAGGHRFDPVHLHQARLLRQAARDHRHGASGAVLFFDMVKRECVAEWIKPFGSVSVFTREKCGKSVRAGFSPVRGGSCWRRAKRFARVRVNEGHLVDALAPRGDEGRGTLRKARMSREQALTPGSPNGATHRASGIPDRIHRSGRRTRRTETSQ